MWAEGVEILRQSDNGAWHEHVGRLRSAGLDPRWWSITPDGSQEAAFAEACAARGGRAVFWVGAPEEGIVPPICLEADGTLRWATDQEWPTLIDETKLVVVPLRAEPWPEEEGTGIFTTDGIELSEAEANEWAARIFGEEPSMPLPGDSAEILAYLAAGAAPPDSLAPAVSTLSPDPATEALRQAAIRRDLRQLHRERDNGNAPRVGPPSVPLILASREAESATLGSRRLEPPSWWPVYVLRALGYLWCCAAGLLVAVGLGSIWLHHGWTAVQETLSPFNVRQWLVTAVLLAPGLLALRAADWLEDRRESRHISAQR